MSTTSIQDKRARTAIPAEIVEMKPCTTCTVDTRCNEHQPKTKKAFKALGRGLRHTGAAVIDFNLRDIGTGVKAVGHKIPKVQIVRENSTKE